MLDSSGGQNGLAAIFGHHIVETREALIGNTAAALEAFDDVVLYATQKCDVLRESRQVVAHGRGTVRNGACSPRQAEGEACRIDIYNTGGRMAPSHSRA